MESTVETTSVNKAILLDPNRYDYWKVRIMQHIRGLGEDVWTAVEEGWEPPSPLSEEGFKLLKPKATWTMEEKNLSKFHARALNTIFSSAREKEFKLIQGCKSAKQAWDILQKTHEGTMIVKMTRLDQLASNFETLKMDSQESIGQFSSKLSAIANEAEVLGKTYKDKKLVKKLLRCLPQKFSAHKAVMRVSGSSNSIKFKDLVGMLKSKEMEVDVDRLSKSKGIAFFVEEDRDSLKGMRDEISLMARNFGKALDRVSQGSNQDSSSQFRGQYRGNEKGNFKTFKTNEDRDRNQKDVECFECGAFVATTETSPLTSNSESDDECPQLNPREAYKELYFSYMKIQEDNARLEQDISDLESDIKERKEAIRIEQKEDNIMEVFKKFPDCNSEDPEVQIKYLQELICLEKQTRKLVQQEIHETYEKLRQFNNDTQQLERILTMGRTESSHWGLGYPGWVSSGEGLLSDSYICRSHCSEY
ncbi:hypothetical protein AALP_AA4G012100 [Arabis alpina]|uniref:DUF4219 domain-containing protein n=1 Tax=Arabis alpina TaxID=50452 RepID=A0A087H0E5_ARAAL|nr:hypothetical protein AALP_AA4G012100 [Arabis alpina]